MRRRCLISVAGLTCLVLGTPGWSGQKTEQQAAGVQWIWFNEGDPTKEAPAETRYFRKVFMIDRPVQKVVDEATLDITADDAFTVWINGVEVGKGDYWRKVYHFDVQAHLVHGKNVIAVQASNRDGPAGLLVRLSYVPNGTSREAQVSDGSWKVSKTAAKGWLKVDFVDSNWLPVKVLGPYGQTGPWRDVVWAESGDDRFTVPAGFRVEMVAKNPNPKDPFSLINLTFDDRGRLLLSQENGGLLLCTQPNKEGVFQIVKPYCKQVTYCQGMCWVKDALLLVGNGPQGTGLYRVRDTHGDDQTDEVTLLHKFPSVNVPSYGVNGGMGEHGPHAILHGPDGWLYLVVGNHAWAKPDKLAANSPLTRWPHGQMGPDQGQPGTTEDVLLPRLNDGRGHAANILAPGGTIWRLDREGQNMSLVAAGFRNAYDAAFSPSGELFTFDSDMEWDEALPWYRAVRVCHCPPGADFLWRTGAANTPDYYIDSLPPIVETGRGSPVGMEFYDHSVFPEKYRGALFMGDWSLGIIWAVHLERSGASYKAKAEKFCQGAPMNVTDVAVGPDGALYFTMGGRGSQGGVYRIVYDVKSPEPEQTQKIFPFIINQPQPLAAWSRARLARAWDQLSDEEKAEAISWMAGLKQRRLLRVPYRIKALTALQNLAPPKDAKWLTIHAFRNNPPEIRAHAIWLLGVNGYVEGHPIILNALEDEDALVRRRACEALIRAGIEPPVKAIWPLLGDDDRFVRTAARLVLQRIDAQKWTERLWQETRNNIAFEGIVALCKTNQTAPFAEQIFQRLQRATNGQTPPAGAEPELLDYLRTVQLALIYSTQRPDTSRAIARGCLTMFPQKDWRVNRELAILLTYFRREKLLEESVHAQLLDALVKSKNDRRQQIHYFYCLRLLHEGWTAEQKQALLAWYDSTKSWIGGHSFSPFLENILRDLNPAFTDQDRKWVVANGDKLPWTLTAFLHLNRPEQQPAPATLEELYERVLKAGPMPRSSEIREAIITTVAQNTREEGQAALRKIEDKDPGQRDAVARCLARSPSPQNWPYLVRGLESQQPVVLVEAINALLKIAAKPKAEDPASYRLLLLASSRLDSHRRWQAVKLLRHWTSDKRFGAEEGDWKTELSAWSKWFAQSFPNEPALPDIASAKPFESKYKFAELRDFLENDPAGRKGDSARGRIVFEKAQCLKCHKYGKEGEGIGPDLTTVSKRFKRADILESIVDPSKVISDQYRSTLIVTKKGTQINGLAAPQGETVTVLQSDGTKVTLNKDEIEQQFASLVSVMPEKLLDPLTKQEIADLFAFMESEPP